MFRELLEQAAATRINEDNEAFLPKIKRGEMDICTLDNEEIRSLYRLYVSIRVQISQLQGSWHNSCRHRVFMTFCEQRELEKKWNELQQKLLQLANMIPLGLEAEVRNVDCYYDPRLLRIRKEWRIVLIDISNGNLVPQYNDPFGIMIDDIDEPED